MTLDDLWQKALGEIEVQIGRTNFLTWIKNSRLIESKNGDVTVALPNTFSKEWVENKYGKMVFGILRNNDCSIKRVAYIVDNQIVKVPPKKKEEAPASQLAFQELRINPQSGLNPHYTLESFIVGSSNELAHAACTSIIKEIGTKYNPLFIYGGTGLGKTHLIQAIGNEIHRHYEGKHKVKYVSSETFTNDLIKAIKNNRTEDMKQMYRNIDVLIIDDIQFIGGREKTEEEFFHTFNALYQNNKQIIISSDRPPKDIPTLEDRLRSRFEGGMIVDVGFPDFETRSAIIRKKLEEQSRSIDNEIIEMLADRTKSNIREIEGVLKKIIFFIDNSKNKIDQEKIRELIEETTRQAVQNITPNQVIRAVAEFYEIPQNYLTSKGRSRDIVEPRQLVMFLLREVLNMSFPFIAEKMGKKDHTTAIYACTKIRKAMADNPAFNRKVAIIRETIAKP